MPRAVRSCDRTYIWWLGAAACLCAFALPFTVAWVRDGSAESRIAPVASASAAAPVVLRLPVHADGGSAHGDGGSVDVPHAVSMMLVGTLLIGIGSVVRRRL